MAKRAFTAYPTWPNDELESNRRIAIANFVEKWNKEGGDAYRSAFAEGLPIVEGLFSATMNLAELATGDAFGVSPQLVQPARFLGGPPVSADDLNTLAGTKISGRTKLDPDLARKAGEIIHSALDRGRFPWLFAKPARAASPDELRLAIRWTTGLWAAQRVATEKRTESATKQERDIKELLGRLGFQYLKPQTIDVTGARLTPGSYSSECVVEGAKCDIPIGLTDGRLLFLECKVSNSAVNSIKRLVRETVGKARLWKAAFGERAVVGAVLEGVFGQTNLKAAQESGVAIIWSHDLGPLRSFLLTAQ